MIQLHDFDDDVRVPGKQKTKWDYKGRGTKKGRYLSIGSFHRTLGKGVFIENNELLGKGFFGVKVLFFYGMFWTLASTSDFRW